MNIRLRYAVPAVLAIVLLCASAGLISKELEAQNKPIVYIPKTMDRRVEFWQVLNQGIYTAAKEFNTQVETMGPATEGDIDEQIELLEQAIGKKPKAIILAATDYDRLVPASQKAIDAGIKLITVDSGLRGGISSSFIATDSYVAGQKAAQTMKSITGPSATLAIASFDKRSSTQMERERGVKDSLKSESGLRIVGSISSDSSDVKAYELTKQLLIDEPELDGIIGLNENSTIGAAKAIRDMDKASKVKLVGFDSSMDEISFIEDGVLQATIVQKPFNMGYLAIKTALEAVDGKSVPSVIDTGSVVITKTNMYTSENQKLLFPFVEK